MAVEYKEQSSSGAFASQSTIVLPKPTNLAVGDLMILHMTIGDSANVSGGTTGWTNVTSLSAGSSKYNTTRNSVWYKIADSTDVASSNVISVTLNSVSTSAGRIATFTGIKSTSTITESKCETVTSNASTGAWSVNNDITPSVANCMLVVFVSVDASNTTNGSYSIETSDPGSWSELWDFGTTLSVDYSQSAAYSAQRPETIS